MKNTQRFDDAYNSLVEAYFNGTLAKGDCKACAVGNICKEPAKKLNLKNSIWGDVFMTAYDKQSIYINDRLIYEGHFKDALLLINETGYTWQELAQIEYAFEINTKISGYDYQFGNSKYTEQEILEDQYNGLIAVVDVMCKLDGIEQVEEKQQKFREHPKLIIV